MDGPITLSWPLAPAELRLADDQVHVWSAWLDSLTPDVAIFEETLSAGELERAARFQSLRDRNRFIARRGLLRKILGRYLGLEPARLASTGNPRAKPFGPHPPTQEPLHSTLTHSQGRGWVALPRRSVVGVDLE